MDVQVVCYSYLHSSEGAQWTGFLGLWYRFISSMNMFMSSFLFYYLLVILSALWLINSKLHGIWGNSTFASPSMTQFLYSLLFFLKFMLSAYTPHWKIMEYLRKHCSGIEQFILFKTSLRVCDFKNIEPKNVDSFPWKADHPSVIYAAYPSGSQGAWSQFHLVSGERWGTSWAGRQYVAGLTQR